MSDVTQACTKRVVESSALWQAYHDYFLPLAMATVTAAATLAICHFLLVTLRDEEKR